MCTYIYIYIYTYGQRRGQRRGRRLRPDLDEATIREVAAGAYVQHAPLAAEERAAAGEPPVADVAATGIARPVALHAVPHGAQRLQRRRAGPRRRALPGLATLYIYIYISLSLSLYIYIYLSISLFLYIYLSLRLLRRHRGGRAWPRRHRDEGGRARQRARLRQGDEGRRGQGRAGGGRQGRGGGPAVVIVIIIIIIIIIIVIILICLLLSVGRQAGGSHSSSGRRAARTEAESMYASHRPPAPRAAPLWVPSGVAPREPL